jgi:hypothetical protein
MRGFDELRTPSDSLWGPMGLDQQLQLIQLTGSQEERMLGALMRYAAPPWKRDHHYARTILFLEHVMQCSLFLGKASCSSFLACRGRYELVPGCT